MPNLLAATDLAASDGKDQKLAGKCKFISSECGLKDIGSFFMYTTL